MKNGETGRNRSDFGCWPASVAASANSGAQRIQYIDMARLYAMAMVFYGHFIERVMMLNDPTAASLYKFIYSFHMVLFFVLSGFISKDAVLEYTFGRYLKHRFFSRLLPFIFFTIVFMILAAIFPGDFYNLKLPSVEGYIGGLVSTLLGIPMFCVPSWFLLMLFSVEMVHYAAFRFLQSDAKILIGIPVFYLAGYWLNLHFDLFNPAKQRMYNFLFIHQAITMYAFYLLGAFLRRKQFLIRKTGCQILVPGAVVSFLGVLLTYKLNDGPFNFNYFNSVVIIFSAHGNILWFPLTAVMGSLFVFFMGKLTLPQKTMVWMGQNTLILMCLNGVFYHYINPGTAKWVFENFSGRPLMIFLAGLIMTGASLLLCIPFVFLFSKYVPQLVGKPKISGPWIKNLI